MRMRVRIGEIGREVKMPEVCPYQGCGGRHFKWHQQRCEKGVRDLKHKVLEVKRCKCLKCGRTFRVYPWGVSRAQQTAALKGLSVMLYMLGISSRGVEDVLRCISDLIGMRVDVGKSTVHRNVQEAGRKSRRYARDTEHAGTDRAVGGGGIEPFPARTGRGGDHRRAGVRGPGEPALDRAGTSCSRKETTGDTARAILLGQST